MDGVLQVADVFLGKVAGDFIGKVGVAIADDEGDAAYQDGGFTASRAGQHQQGAFGGENGLSLHGVQVSVDLVEEGALGGEVAGGEVLFHQIDFLSHRERATGTNRWGTDTVVTFPS